MPVPSGTGDRNRTSAGLDIKSGTPADIDRVTALIADVVAGLRARRIDQWDDLYPTRAVIGADLEAGTLFLAGAGRRLLGMIVLNEHQEPRYAAVDWRFVSTRCLVVHRLCVHPEAEGRGVARALMAYAETAARERGCGALRLDAFTGNSRATALYESLGYRKAGEVMFRKGRFFCYEKAVP